MRALGAGVIVVCLVGPLCARGENWPQWRGPQFNGSTTETHLPTTWSDTENVAWVAPMPGPSGATPIVWGDRIFVSSVDTATKDLLAICLDARDGHVIWKKVTGKDVIISRNNMASPSPVTDGKGVWFLYGTGDLWGFDFDGNVLWSRNLEKDEGKFAILFGYSCSPLLWQDRLYVLVLQRHEAITEEQKDPRDPKPSYILAVDPRTGKNLFKHIRPTDAQREAQEAYTTIMPYDYDGTRQLIVYGGDHLTGHDPRTGDEIWRWEGYNLKHIDHWRVVTSPLVTRDLIYVSGPKKEPFFAVKTGATGSVGLERVAWTFKDLTTDAATPLLYKGRLYLLDGDKNVLSCLDPATGKVIWQGSLGGPVVYRASPTGADNKIYCMSERADVVVLDADQFKVLFRTRMGNMPARSSIVAANGKLLIRTDKKLYCLAQGG